ncbi:MAG TPA: metallophosphoesterase family protein [Nitrospira sp.]|nr:metallophosphoesterase family protein [Nitrospira sp.]
MNRSRPIRIGIIADTSGLFDSTIVRHFQGVNHIVHAGDIGKRSVIEQLEAIAPVTAVSGNVDEYEESGFPREVIIQLNSVCIAIRHVIFEAGKLSKEGKAFLDRTRPDICVFGYTHQPQNEWLIDRLLFNPGSAGPRRFKLPRGLGLLVISEGKVRAYHATLADRAEKSHPLG